MRAMPGDAPTPAPHAVAARRDQSTAASDEQAGAAAESVEKAEMSTGTGAMHRIMLAVGALPGVRVFRCNNGMGWIGDARKLPNGDVLIRNARPLHAGLVKGSSDLIGWTTRVITEADVGKRVAIFTAIEAKDGTGRADADQRRFLDAVEQAGGIAGVARAPEDAVKLVSRE